MAGKQSKFSQHLECPVCLDIFRDPRMLPCEHTICKHCIAGLVHGGSLTCPVCRAKHDTTQAGIDGFMCNLTVSGMIDSLCRGCRSSEPDGKCPHCDTVLCSDCQSRHLTFDVAEQTLQEVGRTTKQGKDAADTADIRQLCDHIQIKVNLAIDYIIEKWQDRRKALLSGVRNICDNDLTSRQAWIERLNVRLEATEAELADLTSRLGNVWDDNTTQEDIADVVKQGEKMNEEMKLFLATIPVYYKPTLLYDNTDALSAISAFGSIHISPSDATDAMAAVSCFESTYTSRPRVVGKEGSGPGQLSYPSDVAVCPVTGRIMVADYGNQRVQVLDDDFTHIMDIRAAGQREGLGPLGVAVTSAGNVIVTCYGSNRVSLYSGTGIYLRDLPGPWSDPHGITVDSDGNIYVCDGGTYSVRVINTAGQVIRTLGGRGTGPGQLSDPPDFIAVWCDDVILSDCAGRLHLFNTSGVFTGQLDPGIIHHAKGLTVDPIGSLVICDTEGPLKILYDTGATRRVEESDNRATRHVGESGKKTWQLRTPRGVAVTKAGQIVVANWNNHNLLVYEVST